MLKSHLKLGNRRVTVQYAINHHHTTGLDSIRNVLVPTRGRLAIRWRKKLVRRNNRDATFVIVPLIYFISADSGRVDVKIEGVSTTGVID